MAKKKKGKSHKPKIYFCEICGEHKSNEKFSNLGRTTHICKKCAALSVDEQSAMQDIRKIKNMEPYQINDSDIQWLQEKMNDPHPEVSAAAQELHRIKYPHYLHNQAKKGLKAFALELYINDTIWGVWDDEMDVHAFFSLDDTGVFRFVNYNAPEAEREVQLSLNPAEASQYLHYAVHELDAPFWCEDRTDIKEADGDEGSAGEGQEPLCTLQISLNTGADKTLSFYHQTPDQAVSLYWALMEWMEWLKHMPDFRIVPFVFLNFVPGSVIFMAPLSFC